MGGSHAVGSVLVDVAVGESDFASNDENDSITLPAESAWIHWNWIHCNLYMGAMDRLEER